MNIFDDTGTDLLTRSPGSSPPDITKPRAVLESETTHLSRGSGTAVALTLVPKLEAPRRRLRDRAVINLVVHWVNWLISNESHHHRDVLGAMQRLEIDYGISVSFLSTWRRDDKRPASIAEDDYHRLAGAVELYAHAHAREALDVCTGAARVRIAAMRPKGGEG